MTDETPDLDSLLAASARGVRPDPAFEEDLLLRIDDELGRTADGIVVELDPSNDTAATTRDRRSRRTGLLARAAVVLALVGAGLGIALTATDDDPSTRTGLPAPAVTLLSDACVKNLPLVAPYAIDGRLSGRADENGWEATVIPDLRAAVDAFGTALDESRENIAQTATDPQPIDELLVALGDIDDRLADEEAVWATGFRDQARGTLPIVANG